MQKFLIYFTLVTFLAGCHPASLDDAVLSSPVPTRQISSTDLVAAATSIPTQVNSFQPIPKNPDENETEPLWKGDQMPIFLEVTQTTIMSGNSAQSPVIGVGPTIYFYNQDSGVLILHSTITIESTTELLIGVNTVLQTPGQVYEKREIVQFPFAQPALIQISAFDAKTGILKLVYTGETFNLSPGESRTFKQVGSDSNASTVITVVSYHGLLADIQLTSSDDSWR